MLYRNDDDDDVSEDSWSSAWFWIAVGVVVTVLILLSAINLVNARDLDGRYANSPNREWFKSLHSKSGTWCCDVADGHAVADVDWQTSDGHYQVRIEGQWVDVPGDAVITDPNIDGRAMVWPGYADDRPIVRCFMPGSMT